MAVNWRNKQAHCRALPVTPALSPAPRPLQYSRVCSSPNNEGAAIVISNFEELSSLFCHFCPNRLCSVVIQITGIQKQFKNCPAEPEPIRPCFANMAQPVFLQQELDLLCQLKAFCETCTSVSQGSNVISCLFVHQTKRGMVSIPGFRGKENCSNGGLARN